MLTQDQIQNIVDEIKLDLRVQGILIAGSYVYGTPNENSDLDVRCITNDGSDWAEFKRVRFGTPVEVFFNPPEKVYKYLEQSRREGHGDAIHFWANGKVVYDSKGVVAQLQNQARELWKEGPEAGKDWNWRLEKHKKYKGKVWDWMVDG